MPEPLFTVLTVNYNSTAFLELMLDAFKQLTKNPYEVIICDNGSSPKQQRKLINLATRHSNLSLIFRDQTLLKETGSVAHGKAMDLLISKVRTKHFVLMDADCTFLKKHWDEEVLSMFDNETKLVGTPYPKELDHKQTKDFPLQFAVVVETEPYRNLGVSCGPKDISIGQDTCWEWMPAYTKAGLGWKLFRAESTRFYHKGPFRELTGVVEYYGNGGIIASHFGRGSTIGGAKYKMGILSRLPKIGIYFRRAQGKRDSQRWIQISQEIIESASKQ